MEPTPIGQGTGKVEVLPGGPDVLPPEFLGAVLEELQEQALGGGTLGFPLLHVRITVLGGQVHASDSNVTAFRMAANDAFHKALHQAGVVLLEPIMRIEVSVPDEHVGDIVSDLQQRRAVITRTHSRGRNMTVVEARAPLANLFGYSNAMRGLSQGRASCTLEPCAYGPAPPEVAQSFLL
jgi:elongation factor G